MSHISNALRTPSPHHSGSDLPSPAARESVVIRFAGDSGDGIQVTGLRFTSESALAGNDICTLPDFPAEIRAPAGTLAGVSGFQIQFGSVDIYTPGDQADVLVAMNPAALKSNLKDLIPGGVLLLNEDAFNEKNLMRVGYAVNPCHDLELQQRFALHVVPMTRLTKDALVNTGLSSREVERCKNFFALGLLLWMYQRPWDHTVEWLRQKFAREPVLAEANVAALKAGRNYGEATESLAQVQIKPAQLAPGTYRNINGTTALAWGLVAAAQKSGKELLFSAYPITPASEVLHELARLSHFGVFTLQAEDEIAAICQALGAAYAGNLGVTSSSGPGIALKMEALNLAVMTELPLVVVDVQRAGPSTGLPTKTEQADLWQAVFGRPGESPVCVLAASSPSNCFALAYEAVRLAVKYMCPVVLLSDAFIANCSEPWALPEAKNLKSFDLKTSSALKAGTGADGATPFLPYARDPQTLARPWAIPGTPGLQHRIGGLEKQDQTGAVSYSPENHQRMVALRAEKIARIVAEIPPTSIDGPESGELLVIGWGGTEGSITKAVQLARMQGLSVSRIHLHFLHPLPPDLATILGRFERVLIPEINSGQLRLILSAKFTRAIAGYNCIQGLPLKVSGIFQAIKECLDRKSQSSEERG